jgi:hypothetical protein
MKMSTQNMSVEGNGFSFSQKSTGEDPGPMPVIIRTVFTPQEREELKEIFHEVLLEYGLVKRIE